MSVGVLQMLDAVIAADRINGRMDCVAVATGVRARALALERAAWRAELMLKHLCDSRLRGEIAAEAREDWRTLVDARAAFNGSAAPVGFDEAVHRADQMVREFTTSTAASDDLIARLEEEAASWELQVCDGAKNPEAVNRNAHARRRALLLREATSRLASTSVQAPSAEWEATDADIAAWLHRHDLAGSLPGCDARAAFEDARSAHLSAAPTQEPPNG